MATDASAHGNRNLCICGVSPDGLRTNRESCGLKPLQASLFERAARRIYWSAVRARMPNMRWPGRNGFSSPSAGTTAPAFRCLGRKLRCRLFPALDGPVTRDQPHSLRSIGSTLSLSIRWSSAGPTQPALTSALGSSWNIMNAPFARPTSCSKSRLATRTASALRTLVRQESGCEERSRRSNVHEPIHASPSVTLWYNADESLAGGCTPKPDA